MYEPIRVQILGSKDLPFVQEVHALVQFEESRRSVMNPPEGETIALAVRSNTNSARKGENQKKVDDKDKLWCTHCQKSRHTSETCWELYGKPNLANSAIEQSKKPTQNKKSAIEQNKKPTQKKFTSANLALHASHESPDCPSSSDPKEDIISSFYNHLEQYGRAFRQTDSRPAPSTSFASSSGFGFREDDW
ncbi:PREDICTED: uncharacterized protein LOC104600488 isoform X2 [Nelumbo nucifera]|uniref:Uncharacterized protein LOC104600488 isoform X2 n=1 Tax=Nelumbo nucifera TaxID=4432 RepID=A0A1U8AH43_NELNU|nr:PREDICTED: uncharacterized protein LOC104600488 isoform X2 [Nelumbo nucifera]